MSHPSEWIGSFLKRYVKTVDPHDFPTAADDDDDLEPGEPTAAECFARKWVYAFSIAHPPISEAEADAAMLRLSLYPPKWKNDHLPAVVEVVLKAREKAAAEQFHRAMAMPAAEVEATIDSADCPECRGNGFAKRTGVWSDRSWHLTTSLFCRCPLGRYRLAKADPDRPGYDDLQAFPALWNPDLNHPTWSSQPTSPPSVEGREWSYLRAGEKAPPPIAAKTARAVEMPAKKRRAEWLGPVPKDLVLPRAIPRSADPPACPPPIDEESTSDHLG